MTRWPRKCDTPYGKLGAPGLFVQAVANGGDAREHDRPPIDAVEKVLAE